MIDLVTFTGPQQQVIEVNPMNVTVVKSPIDHRFPKGTQCIIFTTDGRFHTVIEPCSVVHERLGR
jgi:hypothetical protein